MGKIVAIGGGEIGRAGYSVETIKIDKEIIRLSGKKRPKMLFLPTASKDSKAYFNDIKKHFGRRLGCKVDVLYLIKEKPSKKSIERKIFGSDIVYVGGGNTMKMIRIWKKYGVDKILKTAYEKGSPVLSGVSAGAICWFRYGNSDSKLKETGKLIRVKGLGFINILYCPHYNKEKIRKPSLKKMMKKNHGIALAFHNCAAIEIIDSNYRILSSKDRANAYKVYWKNNKFYHEKIEKKKEFMPLSYLLKR